MPFPKMYYLSWLLRKVVSEFGKNPMLEFSTPIQAGRGWLCMLTDKVNGQNYLCQFLPVETQEKVVMPNTIDEFLKMTEGK